MNPDEARLQAAIAAEEWPTAAFAAGELFARSGQSDPRWAYAAALAEERQGKGAAALAWMARACTAGPDFPPAWDGRVRLALAAGDAADALAAQDHAALPAFSGAMLGFVLPLTVVTVFVSILRGQARR